MIVVPSSVRNDFSASQIVCTIDGCTPSDGSSRIIKVGVADQGAPDRQLLLLAARHGARDLSPALLQPRKMIRRRVPAASSPSVRRSTRQPRRFSSTRHLRKHVAALRDVADAERAPGRRACKLRYILIHEQADRAPPRVEQSNRGIASASTCPRPLRPMTPTISPRQIDMLTPCRIGVAP